jgi:hypothetical protein
MFMKRKKISWSLAIVISLLIGGGGIGYAKVTGMCGNCHTMHNSQGGTHMIINTEIDGTSGVYPYLTRGSCVGCHTGTNDGSNPAPYVYNTVGVDYASETLAGGNFKWVVTDDAKGHNVKGIPGMTKDDALSVAPGDLGLAEGCSSTTCHESLYNTTEVATGCEGCHLDPKHHAPQQAAGTPAVEANGYFRFLSGHENGDGSGVEGIEDSDWQFTKGADDHNEYLGKAGSNTFGGFSVAGIAGNTMTAYCTGCHGNFHTQVDTNSNWIRHPSDAVLPSSGEYTAYSTYDPNVPVARAALTAVSNTVGSTDMVMCLSCHRAHGSPYNDMLRWNYDGMVAGNGSGGGNDGTGCFKCHSEKD